MEAFQMKLIFKKMSIQNCVVSLVPIAIQVFVCVVVHSKA